MIEVSNLLQIFWTHSEKGLHLKPDQTGEIRIHPVRTQFSSEHVIGGFGVSMVATPAFEVQTRTP